MTFVYVFLVIVLILSLTTGIVVTLISQKEKKDSDTNKELNNEEKDKMLNNLSKDVVNNMRTELFAEDTKENETLDEPVKFTAKENKVTEKFDDDEII